MVTNNGTTLDLEGHRLTSLLQAERDPAQRQNLEGQLRRFLDPDGRLVPPEGLPRRGSKPKASRRQ